MMSTHPLPYRRRQRPATLIPALPREHRFRLHDARRGRSHYDFRLLGAAVCAWAATGLALWNPWLALLPWAALLLLPRLGATWVAAAIPAALAVLRAARARTPPDGIYELTLVSATRQRADGGVVVHVAADPYGSFPLLLPAAAREALEAEGPGALARGAVIRADLQVSELPRIGVNPLIASTDAAELIAPAQGVAAAIRARMADTLSALPPDLAGLIPGMSIGDTSAQSPAQRADFLATGLSHLTAVSGANVAIVSSAVLVLAAGYGLRLRLLLAAASIVGFALLVGPDPSVLRASLMGLVGIIGVATGRWAHTIPALGAVMLLLLLADSDMALSPAFALSVVATGGIVLLAPRVDRGLRRLLRLPVDHPSTPTNTSTSNSSPTSADMSQTLPSRLSLFLARTPILSRATDTTLRGIAVAVAADLVTAPVILIIMGIWAPVAVLANLLVAPAVPPITIIGLTLALIPWPPLAWLAALPAWWVDTVATHLAAAPILTIDPRGSQFLLFAFFFASYAFIYRRRPPRRRRRRRDRTTQQDTTRQDTTPLDTTEPARLTPRRAAFIAGVSLGILATSGWVHSAYLNPDGRPAAWTPPRVIHSTPEQPVILRSSRSDLSDAELGLHGHAGLRNVIIAIPGCGPERPSRTPAGTQVVYLCGGATEIRGMIEP